jgi:hypothetical protein
MLKTSLDSAQIGAPVDVHRMLTEICEIQGIIIAKLETVKEGLEK